MKLYESIVIIKGDLNQKEIDTYFIELKDVLKKHNAKMVKLEKWGKKRLTYPIKKEKKGFFFLIHYQVESANVKKITRNFMLLENTLRFFTVLLEKENLVKKDLTLESDKEEFVSDFNPETGSKGGKDG